MSAIAGFSSLREDRGWLGQFLILHRFVKFKTFESYYKYKRYRNLLNRVINQAKIRYYHFAINNSRGNSGELWKVIRKLIQSRQPKQSASTLIENSYSETQSAELFNNYFVNIGENFAKKLPCPIFIIRLIVKITALTHFFSLRPIKKKSNQ